MLTPINKSAALVPVPTEDDLYHRGHLADSTEIVVGQVAVPAARFFFIFTTFAALSRLCVQIGVEE